MTAFKLLMMNINMFDPTNKTTDAGLSDEMKIFYSDYLIDLAEPELVHDQFAQKHPIPKNGGKVIEFRKYDSLANAMKPLDEGITPKGNKLNMSTITSEVSQYGDYIELSDVLLLTAIDNNLVQATKLLASQAGRTLDTVTREVLNGGSNVMYVNGKTTRGALTGGQASGNDYVTVLDLKKAVRALKVQNAPKINGKYCAILHPDVAFDIMNDPEWKYPHQYADTKNIYDNEIGEIAGIRFVESTEAKIFTAEKLYGDSATVTVSAADGAKITVTDNITEDDAKALPGKRLLVGGYEYSILNATPKVGTTKATITLREVPSTTPSGTLSAGGAGAESRPVYSTLIMGDNAYGVTEIAGGGLQHIVKQLGSGGTTDPLNQRATAGWKAIKTAERLVEQYMIRLESVSTFDDLGAN